MHLTNNLRYLLQKTTLFFIILDKKGHIIQMNERCEACFSIDSNTALNIPLHNLVLDEDRAKLNQIITEIQERKSISNQHLKFSANTTEGFLGLKLDFSFDGECIHAIGVDISQEDKEHQILVSVSKFTKVAAWYYNPKTEELFWSKECYELHGIDPNDPSRKEKRQYSTYKGSRERIKKALQALMESKEPFDYIEKIPTLHQNEKFIHIIAEPVIFNGEVIFVNGTVTDVTEKQVYLEKLKHSEETKKLALKGIKSGLFDHLIETNLVYFSPSFRKMLGLSLEEDFLPEETFRKMIHPEDEEIAYKRHLDNLNKEGEYYFNYCRLKHIDGIYRHYEIHGYRKKDEHGKTIRMIGNLIDVNEKKLNEETILRNQSHLQAMINNGFVYTFLLDVNGYILMTDKASASVIEEDFKVNPNKTNCRFIDILPLNFKHTFAYSFNEALKGNTTSKETERITNKGNSQWLEVKYTPIPDHTGTVSAILVGFHDITERKMAELTIKESHIKEQELNSLKTNILSNFSHEIRTPLNGIMAISNLLITENDQQEREKLLEYLNDSKDRLLETITNLSNFSEVEAIKANLDLVICDANYTVETSYREYDHLAEAKNLEYKLILDESIPKVKINEDLFRTAFNNIIHNAIKYTHTGSIIITIFKDDSKENVCISIKDTGIGIEPENLEKIFDPFIQESIGMSRKYEGTGIGLSLSKRYIEILGGTISVMSEPSKGSEFLITLPLCL